jgi:hypothetical protein
MAYYIIGFHGRKNRFYYLDPHYVNPACDPQKIDLSTYTSKTVHEYSYSKMNSSLQISFLVKGNLEFKDLIGKMRDLIQKYGHENSFIAVMDTDKFDYDDEGLEDF